MKINLKEDKDRIPELIAQDFALGDMSNWTEQEAIAHTESLRRISDMARDIIQTTRCQNKT